MRNSAPTTGEAYAGGNLVAKLLCNARVTSSVTGPPAVIFSLAFFGQSTSIPVVVKEPPMSGQSASTK
jgi:hypothetical protein